MIDTAPQTAFISGEQQDVVQLYFGNAPKGGLLITKKDAINGVPLSSVEFLIADSSGAVLGDGNGKFTTDASGSILISGLTPGLGVVAKESRAISGCGIEYSSSRGNVRQTALNALKGFMAVSLFTIVPVRLYALSVSLQGSLAYGITGAGASIGSVGQEIMNDFTGAGLSDVLGSSHFGLGIITSPIMLLFCIILMAYAVIKVFFANLKRGGILLIQIAVGSLYMFSVPRGYTDGFTQWMRQVIGLCLTAFLQSTILVAGLMAFRSHALLGLGLMLSAGEVPRIAGAFGLDTSTRASIHSAVYTAQAAVNTTRTIVAAAAK